MCGICGKIFTDVRTPVDPRLLQGMCDVLQHRGPDEDGVYIEGHVGLGHRRLSIIDLATGQQPMSNTRQDIWIVYNGEVYNFPELREELLNRGYQFQTTSDTEVILHLYAEYGPECVKRLRGMFAFAIWDVRRQRLFLARDRVGQKPLFYHATDTFIAFASEIKALLQDPAIPREVNLEAMSQYLTYQYVPPPETMFAHIAKLPPAHTLIWEQGNVSTACYWTLSYHPKVNIPTQEIEARLTDIVRESVNLRMISDVPIGAFLSGGVDSSVVVAFMAQCSSRPVNTFSIGFQEKAFNELPYARLVAERFHTDHHEFIVEPNALEVLPELIWHFDEPFGDSSAIPTYYVSQLTGQHVKVALNGDGGDESFGGYVRYLGYTVDRYYRKIPFAIRRTVISGLFERLSAWKPELPRLLRYARFVNELSFEPPEHLYARAMTIFTNDFKARVLSDEVKTQIGEEDSLNYMLAYFQTEFPEHFTDKMLYSDVMTYLPGDLLVKIDRMTMAHGLEGRSPFLDHRLMEFVAALPPAYKIRGTQLKFLLKALGKTLLPREILTRPKQGFRVPLGRWFRNELRDMVHDILSAPLLAQENILNASTLSHILQEHQKGQRDHHHRIWLLLNLELWYRKFIKHG